jgi:hypothetical protein
MAFILPSFIGSRGPSRLIELTRSTTGSAINIFTEFGSPTAYGTYVYTISATISAGSATYALRTGSFPPGSVLKIINNGTIRGKGGDGGGGSYTGSAGTGGNAILLDQSVDSLDNTNGYIYGGGGGGGLSTYQNGSNNAWAAGGGGQGSNGGAAGAQTPQSGATLVVAPTAGTESAAGTGGSWTDTSGYGSVAGGGGGTWGSAGSAGNSNTSVGAVAGKAIALTGFSCPITGGNNGTQIKGSVV